METEDPRAALDDPKVPVRAAGARDLARHGTWDDMELLVARGWGDRSIAVRLYAAAAAADIACRHKGAHGQERLTPEQQQQVLQWAFGHDPGRNPSMLVLVGAVETEEALRRLARIVRDPRSDVRLGVVTALRRMILSAAADARLVGAAITAWLDDDRVPDDTRLELVKIVGEAGLFPLQDRVLSVRQRGGAVGEVADVALARLAARREPSRWAGLWRSDGLDVFELADAPRDDRLALLGGGVFHAGGERWPVDLDDGGARIGGGPARLVWATPLGAHEPALALQVDGRTWWAVGPADVADVVDARWGELAGLPPEAFAELRAALDAAEGVAAQRAAAVVAWLAGDAEGAVARLEGMMGRKRPRADLFWWRGRALADLGRAEEARADLAAFLERSRRGQPHVQAAEALLAELGGA